VGPQRGSEKFHRRKKVSKKKTGGWGEKTKQTGEVPKEGTANQGSGKPTTKPPSKRGFNEIKKLNRGIT